MVGLPANMAGNAVERNAAMIAGEDYARRVWHTYSNRANRMSEFTI